MKATKSAEKSYLMKRTYFWDHQVGGSSPSTRTMQSVLIGSEYPVMDTLLFYFSQNSYCNLFRGVAECYAFSCFHDNVGLRDLPAIWHIKGANADIPSLVMPCSLVWPAALLSTRRTLAAHPRPQRTFEFLGAERRQEPLPRDRESPCRSHIHEKCQNLAGCNARGT